MYLSQPPRQWPARRAHVCSAAEIGGSKWLLVSTAHMHQNGPEALVAGLAVVVAGHARRPRAAHRGDGGARREAGAVARHVVEAEVPALAAQQAQLLAPVCQGNNLGFDISIIF